MEIMKVTCGNCAGVGSTSKWEVVSKDEHFGTFNTMKRVDDIKCEVCNGKGYTEYAVFSVEEAKAILKHCGLSTENEANK